MPNRLAESSSPYLLQHADNPVDWLPWGSEAFERARSEDRPILLSIGYSACHWCHVMAHESFEDPDIAARMNAGFVNVKVDREERPDVDALYMEAVQAMTGRGGWPLTAFLTPEGEPFYGGTYFPPKSRHGLPGFPQLLEGIADAWTHRRAEVLASAEGLTRALRASAEGPLSDVSPAPGLAGLPEAAAEHFAGHFDRQHGGFGGAPKFPQSSALGLLADLAWVSPDPERWHLVELGLDAMARGGIWDHLGGGFHRYSVDESWSVPHFEKMLYDNAQLALLYAQAAEHPMADRPAETGKARAPLEPPWALAFGASRHRAIAEAIRAYLIAEMQSPQGPFYASQDADTSEGEGKFFAWSPEEVHEAMERAKAGAGLAGSAEISARRASAWFGLDRAANFEEGRSVLASRRAPAVVAAALGEAEPVFLESLAGIYRALRSQRDRREAPATDRKIITAWNGLAIEALARLEGRALDRIEPSAAALAARFILDEVRVGGGLAHSWMDGRSGAPAFLEDYAAMGGACLTLYETGFDPRWFQDALALAEGMIERFADPAGGAFFRSGPEHERLIVRQKELVDAALPSGNALALDLLLRLEAFTGRGDFGSAASEIAGAAAGIMQRAPLAAASMLRSLNAWRGRELSVAIIGPAEAGAADLLAALPAAAPGLAVAWSAEDEPELAAQLPLLASRGMIDGRAAAYLCAGQRCLAPIHDAAALASALTEAFVEARSEADYGG